MTAARWRSTRGAFDLGGRFMREVMARPEGFEPPTY